MSRKRQSEYPAGAAAALSRPACTDPAGSGALAGRPGLVNWRRALEESSQFASPFPPAPLTPEEARRRFGPAQTLGAPEEVRLACDHQLAESGVYNLLQQYHDPAGQFMGYAALQDLAQNGLIRACISTVADDLTRAWIEPVRDGAPRPGPSGSQKQKRLDPAEWGALPERLKAELDRFELRRVFHTAVEQTGYVGGALIFIDTGASGKELALPLHIGQASAELTPERPLRFQVIDPVNVFPGPYNSDNPLHPDYFQPQSWWVLGRQVHKSRLLRIVANEPPLLLRPAYNFFGIPQAQILWDYALHFQECRLAGQRLLTKFSLTVLKTQMQDILTQAGGTEQLDRRVQYFVQHRSNDGVQVIDKETEDLISLETPLSGVCEITRQALEFLAAINRTPAVKLLGISPSGFNATGESDLRNYYDHIRSQQEKLLRPALETVLKILQIRLTGQYDPSLTFDFAPLGQSDQAALAAVQKTRAETCATYLEQGVISREEVRRALAADPNSGFENLDADNLPAMAAKAQGLQ